MKFFLTLFLLAMVHLQSIERENNPLIIWKGNSPENFTAAITASSRQISIDHPLELSLIVTYPSTHLPDWTTTVKQLLSYDGFGVPPFMLISQKIEPQPPKAISESIFTQKLILELYPQITGNHFLTFYDIPFIPVKKTEDEIKHIVSGIVTIEVTSSDANFDPALIIAPPMPLTTELPITISTSNQRKYIKNASKDSEAAAKNVITLKERKIPWELFAALFTWLVIIMILKFPNKN